jgi:broad specificity phosphatase PhoE
VIGHDHVAARQVCNRAGQLQDPVKVSAAWREIDFGTWEGLTYAEVAEQFEDQLGFFTNLEQCSPPGGESSAQMLERAQVATTTRSRFTQRN